MCWADWVGIWGVRSDFGEDFSFADRGVMTVHVRCELVRIEFALYLIGDGRIL